MFLPFLAFLPFLPFLPESLPAKASNRRRTLFLTAALGSFPTRLTYANWPTLPAIVSRLTQAA